MLVAAAAAPASGGGGFGGGGAGTLGGGNAPILAPAIGIPIAAVTVLLLGFHMAFLEREQMPESRRRIRRVNGWLMLVTTPILAYAFCIARPADARTFVLAWMAAVGLIGLIVMLASLDMINNWRIHRRTQAAIRAEMAEAVRSGKQLPLNVVLAQPGTPDGDSDR